MIGMRVVLAKISVSKLAWPGSRCCTSRNAIPGVAPRPAKNSESASTPPAEAPTPTILKEAFCVPVEPSVCGINQCVVSRDLPGCRDSHQPPRLGQRDACTPNPPLTCITPPNIMENRGQRVESMSCDGNPRDEPPVQVRPFFISPERFFFTYSRSRVMSCFEFNEVRHAADVVHWRRNRGTSRSLAGQTR